MTVAEVTVAEVMAPPAKVAVEATVMVKSGGEDAQAMAPRLVDSLAPLEEDIRLQLLQIAVRRVARRPVKREVVGLAASVSLVKSKQIAMWHGQGRWGA